MVGSLPRPPSSSAWSRRVEAASLVSHSKLLAQARRNTARARQDTAFLMGLARELAVTRGPELTRSFRSLVWVSPGFRRRRGGRRGQRVLGEVCVVFVVRHKRELPDRARDCLPRWLIVYAEHGGERLPFAIPTDVQETADYRAAVAHADSGVWLQREDLPAAHGSFAALVKLRHDTGSATCVLSAQHVLTPYAEARRLRVVAGLPVMPLNAAGRRLQAPPMAATLPVGGLLRGDERSDRPSFDVQLAELKEVGGTELRRRVPLRRLNATQPWMPSLDALLAHDRSGWFHLLTPDNNLKHPGRGAVRMTVSTLPPQSFGLPYLLDDGTAVRPHLVFHEELLAFTAVDEGVPWPGDSGSPIVARRTDGSLTLAAMHIAGDPARGLSWAIPAWRLFNLAHWSQFPSGAKIDPIEP